MIIWIASYPKSGNTLLRSILISLIYTDDGNVDFNKLKLIGNFPGGPFFIHGKIGRWKNILKEEMVSEIEKKFYKEMSELNYLP